jgi:hypothetical protein
MRDGARAVATRIGLSDTTTARLAARLPCHRASVELAARRLGLELDIDEREEAVRAAR